MGAIRDSGLFTTAMIRRDDGSDGGATGIPIGFSLHFYRVAVWTTVWINNNGSITLNGAYSTFIPHVIAGAAWIGIIAPFFADVDTRGLASDVVRYGQATIGGKKVFGVNWINVGSYNQQDTLLNQFQLILTDRSDVAVGDFDIEFNYDQILWEYGDAGIVAPRAGWNSGNYPPSLPGIGVELPGSGVLAAFLDATAGPSTLITHSLNSNVLGRYIWHIRSGVTAAGEVAGALTDCGNAFTVNPCPEDC